MLSINEKEFQFEQKYRPTTIDECILPEKDVRVFKALIAEKRIPNIILHSPSPGTGKTTVARCLVNDIDAEFMFVNGSDAKIDFVRNVMTPFASSKTMHPGGKVIIIDEFDRPGLAESQRHLRSFMEAHSNNCTFIITANNINGIIDALQSRCRVIQFGQATESDKVAMMKRMIQRAAAILKHEDVKLEEPKVLAALVKQNFPDFRKVLNMLDWYSKHGKIDAGILSLVLSTGGIEEIVTAIKEKNVKELRSLAAKNASDYSNLIQKLLDALYHELKPISIPRMIEIIGENNQYHGLVANLEIHIMFLFVQLVTEVEFK